MKKQNGFAVIISVFLFLLLTIFALTLAQMVAVDSQVWTEDAGGGVTRQRVGPKKEIERLQALYLAQAGIAHLRAFLVQNPMSDSLTEFYENDDDTADPTDPIGYYSARIEQATTVDFPNHTLLQDIVTVSQAHIPPHSGSTPPESTDLELRETFWQSPRVYASAVESDFPPYMPIQAVDTTNNNDPDCGVPNCGGGLDNDMRTRWRVFAGGEGQPTILNDGGAWIPRTCGGSGSCVTNDWIYIDFGELKTFDEVRFLNRYISHITQMELFRWDDTGGVDGQTFWNSLGVKSYPRPDATVSLAPFYMDGRDPVKMPNRPCHSDDIYNGDRCTFFENLVAVKWDAFGGGGSPDECTASGSCASLGASSHDYVGRFKLTGPVTSRRLKIQIKGDNNAGAGTTFNVEELAVYCCDNDYTAADPFPDPPNVVNILKRDYGRVIIGFTGPDGTTITNANSTDSRDLGTTLKSAAQYE